MAKNTFLYKMIQLRAPMRLPKFGMPMPYLVNVDGIPHAGGIDVRFDDIVRTITWANIAHADRALPAEVGA